MLTYALGRIKVWLQPHRTLDRICVLQEDKKNVDFDQK